MQLLRTIFIIILVYYLFRLIARYVLPWVTRYFIRKSMEGIEKQQQPGNRKSGEINIDYSPDKKEKLENIGEYIDYEELEDDKTDKS